MLVESLRRQYKDTLSMEKRLKIHIAEGRRYEIVDVVGQEHLAGRRCHEVLWGQQDPCAQCAVLGLGLGRDECEQSSVVRVTGGYRVSRAARTPHDIAIVTCQLIGDAVCKQLLAARLDALAADAGLSPQERKVLELLALGRTHADIARALGITTRTVRFHQENLCAKLGAESRADLVRVLLS